MAMDTGPGLRELVSARRTELEVLAEKLSQRLRAVREELEELAVAERVACRLAERLPAGAGTEAASSPAAGQVAGRAVLLFPHRERGLDVSALPEDCQRIMDVTGRADGPLMVKDICRELGIDTAPARVEATVRSCTGSPNGIGCSRRRTGSSARR